MCMSLDKSKAQLFSVEEAGRLLGGISPWTLRKHISRGNVRVTRLGRRVFLDEEEMSRIVREGLPSLGNDVTDRSRQPRRDSSDEGDAGQLSAGDRSPEAQELCVSGSAAVHSSSSFKTRIGV
jgi:hypothetical protein